MVHCPAFIVLFLSQAEAAVDVMSP
ncbi:uncharacterized protein METZ01_LOCUS437180 [marine metagenome]|uniref:Uncharacterized protein n=1 Tax=marine metagenome TaxID=408172 RepID=A0A382YM03_9ZZZZ